MRTKKQIPTQSSPGFSFGRITHLYELTGHLYWSCVINMNNGISVDRNCDVYAAYNTTERGDVADIVMPKNTLCKVCPVGKVRNGDTENCDIPLCGPGKYSNSEFFFVIP